MSKKSVIDPHPKDQNNNRGTQRLHLGTSNPTEKGRLTKAKIVQIAMTQETQRQSPNDTIQISKDDLLQQVDAFVNEKSLAIQQTPPESLPTQTPGNTLEVPHEEIRQKARFQNEQQLHRKELQQQQLNDFLQQQIQMIRSIPKNQELLITHNELEKLFENQYFKVIIGQLMNFQESLRYVVATYHASGTEAFIKELLSHLKEYRSLYTQPTISLSHLPPGMLDISSHEPTMKVFLIKFLKTCGLDPNHTPKVKTTDIFSSNTHNNYSLTTILLITIILILLVLIGVMIYKLL